MNILGIGGSVHDFSSCIVVNGEVVSAIEEERLSRIKYHPLEKITGDQLKLRSVDYCLAQAGLTLEDVDGIFSNDLIFPLAIRGLPTTELINHHLSHAAAAFFQSPFDEAAVLVMDGFGSIHDGQAETVSYFTASGSDLSLAKRYHGSVAKKRDKYPFSWSNFDMVTNSVGVFYSHMTERLGFGAYEEGKTMGLAAYGSMKLAPDLAAVVELGDYGDIRFGKDERAAVDQLVYERISRARSDGVLFQIKADFARAAQVILERSVLLHAAAIRELTSANVLCASGGIFMNCAANYRLLKEGPFKEVFIHGASGDNGTCLGAALYGYHLKSGEPRRLRYDPLLYGGRHYSDHEILSALKKYLADVTYDRPQVIAKQVARLLAEGHVMGWYQGRSEFGARALGNRSILCDPRDPGAKDRINAMVKGREGFRPFAPAVLWERQADYYDIHAPSPYMCVNAMTHDDGPAIPAVTHVDGSARFQTVSKRDNELFHSLLSEFEALTGVGVLLNTSFNEREPIVETPEQAIECFLRTELDLLAIGPFLVRKVV